MAAPAAERRAHSDGLRLAASRAGNSIAADVIEDVHTSLQHGYGEPPSSSTTTLAVIHRFIRTRRMASPHLAPEQRQYLERWVEFAQPMSGVMGTLRPQDREMAHSAVCVIRKANAPRAARPGPA